MTSPTLSQAELRERVARLVRYVEMRREKPLRQMDDVIHGVHKCTEWEAELRLSDLNALAGLVSSTKGFLLVPVEPTEEMLAAADSAIPRFEADLDGYRLMGTDGARECWAAMIAAAQPLAEPPDTR